MSVTRRNLSLFLPLGTPLLLLLVTACSPPVTLAPHAQTVTKLRGVYRAITVLEAREHRHLGEQFQQITNLSLLEDKWAFLATNKSSQLEMNASEAVKMLCQDGYGSSLMLAFSSNLTDGIRSRAHFDPNSGIVVWSVGPNRVDERGGGDDIILPLNDPMVSRQ